MPQAKLFGAGGLASTAGSTPRGPSGHQLHRTRSTRLHAHFLSISAASLLRSRHGLVARARGASIGILASPAWPAAVAASVACLCVLATFATSAWLAGSVRPPSRALLRTLPPARTTFFRGGATRSLTDVQGVQDATVVLLGVASAWRRCVLLLSPPTLRVRSELVCPFGSVIASCMLCE